MRSSTVALGALSTASLAAAFPQLRIDGNAVNPFVGKQVFANPTYAAKLNKTISSFLAQNDTLNAARTRTVQHTGTFVWITTIAAIADIDTAIASARAAQKSSGQKQIVGLVLYNLPDRDCSAGESAGELSLDNDGLNKYKHLFVDAYAAALKKAPDLSFAVVLEPDSLGNLITNQNVPLCQEASSGYEEGIAYAIAKLQLPNVALYVDAAHGGWLGWDSNLEPAAKEFAKVVEMANSPNVTGTHSSGSGKKATIRGFSTNVSNYNPFIAKIRENYTEWNNAYDESHYATVLSEHLANYDLPQNFIIDQGRVALPHARATWGEWCNVAPSGFGQTPTTHTNNTHVDSIVWVKPGGESDGACGMAGAPAAGQWFEDYAEMLVKDADPPLIPTYPGHTVSPS